MQGVKQSVLLLSSSSSTKIARSRDEIAQFVVFIVLSKHLEAKSCDLFTIFGILTALATLRTLVPFMVYMTSMLLLAFSVTLNSHALSLYFYAAIIIFCVVSVFFTHGLIFHLFVLDLLVCAIVHSLLGPESTNQPIIITMLYLVPRVYKLLLVLVGIACMYNFCKLINRCVLSMH